MDPTEAAEFAQKDAKTPEFVIERYKYILQQIHHTNENVYKFLAIFQTIATTIATGILALFVSYRKWGISPTVAHTGIVGLLSLVTASAGFTILLIIVGVWSWIDYRREECELAERFFQAGFRKPPRLRNLFRWYETYIVLFVAIVTGLMWILAIAVILPQLR